MAETGRVLTAKAFARALVLIVPYACLLIGLSVAAHYGAATGEWLPAQFYLSKEESFGEFLEYSLTAACAVMLGLLWWRKRAPVHLTNALLFVWLTLDNWLEVHEHLGEAIGPALPSMPIVPVESNHLGEALLFGIVGAIWLAGLATALRSTGTRDAIHTLLLAICIGVAAFFGVFVDLLVVWGESDPMRKQFLAFIEDGGEFVAIIAAFAIAAAIFDLEYWRADKPAV